MTIKTTMGILAGKASHFVLSKLGRGSTLPGKIALKFDKDILIEHTIKRFDAQSLVYKRRKEVEEAEYQVKTLNEVE